MKIISTDWIAESQGCIGIVVIENEGGERKAYVGTGAGFSEDADRKRIIDWGGKLYPHVAKRIAEALETSESTVAPAPSDCGDVTQSDPKETTNA